MASHSSRRRHTHTRRTVNKTMLGAGGVAVVVGGLAVAAGIGPNSPFHHTPVPHRVTPYSAPASAHAKAPDGAPDGHPMRVVVLGDHDTTIVNTGMVSVDSPNGVLNPPTQRAGWYKEAGYVKPGFKGVSIIAGHVDYHGDPDVFQHLDRVRKGDRVIVTYSSGEEVHFVVDRTKVESRTQVPDDSTIWTSTKKTPVLRLLTCDPQSKQASGHFDDNFIAWAHRVDA